MAIFYRIYNNQLFSAGEVPKLGFDVSSPYFIPYEYLDKQEFMVMRTCHGIGDWCLLSSMPRLLKEKYPNCKVYVHSPNLLKNIFGNLLEQWGYKTYDSSFVTLDIFKNNPYVDEFVDTYEGEIFHDHYRLYDPNNSKIPLVEQILKFWQFQDHEIADSTPDIFFSQEEIKSGDDLILKFWDSSPFGYISVSSTYGQTAESDNLIEVVKQYKDYNWFYYGETPIKDTNLSFLKNVIEIKPLGLSLREQMYLKTKAQVNIGNETGANLWSSKYSKTYVLSNRYYGSNHGGNNVGKPRKDPFSSGNFVKNVIYI